jgi:membrane fusion protein
MPNSHSQTSTQVSNSRRPASPLFRDQAAASLRRRWFGPVQLLVPPSALTAVGIATVAVAMLTVAMAVIEIPDRIRTVGLLVPVDGLLKIRASRAGRVEQLIVRNGDTVVERQVLMRISGSQQAPGREPELTARVESLRRVHVLM